MKLTYTTLLICIGVLSGNQNDEKMSDSIKFDIDSSVPQEAQITPMIMEEPPVLKKERQLLDVNTHNLKNLVKKLTQQNLERIENDLVKKKKHRRWRDEGDEFEGYENLKRINRRNLSLRLPHRRSMSKRHKLGNSQRNLKKSSSQTAQQKKAKDRERIMDKLVYKYFRSSPVLFYKRSEFCYPKCLSKHTRKYRDSYIRKNCYRLCMHYGYHEGRKLLYKVSHNQRKYFYLFYDNDYKCDRRNTEVAALCRKTYKCYGRNLSSNCLKCINDGKKGAQVACTQEFRKPHRYESTGFNRYRRHFQRKKFHCTACEYEAKTPCANLCKKNLGCTTQCIVGAKAACIYYCKNSEGNKEQEDYYTKTFKDRMKALFLERVEDCNGCDSLCNSEIKKSCISNDNKCRSYFNKICKHECKFKLCTKYKSSYKNMIKKKNYDERKKNELFYEKLMLDFNRLKKKQAHREEFDEKKIHKLSELVFRYNRDTIYDSILYMEGMIYQEQRKLTKGITKATLSQEQELQQQIDNAYISEEELRKQPEEINVFEV